MRIYGRYNVSHIISHDNFVFRIITSLAIQSHNKRYAVRYVFVKFVSTSHSRSYLSDTLVEFGDSITRMLLRYLRIFRRVSLKILTAYSSRTKELGEKNKKNKIMRENKIMEENEIEN